MGLPVVAASALLTRVLLLGATNACALFNGLSLSPLSDAVDFTLGAALRGYPLVTRAFVYNYATPLAITVMTLAIAGIPAAIYERIRGHKSSTPVSLAIWLIAALLLSLPTILRAIGGSDEL